MNKYYFNNSLKFSNVEVGDLLSTLDKRVNEVDVVRFCAAIRNYHRFHFDQKYTEQQGISGIIVPGFLLGNWCIEAVSRSFEPDVEIASLKFRNTATAPIDQNYEISGEVASIDEPNSDVVRCDMVVKEQNTEKTVTTATVGIRKINN